MGLYDRDYYHDDDDDTVAGYFGARPRSGQRMMVTTVVLVTVGFWIADNLTSPPWLSPHLRLPSDVLRHPLEYYRLLTYGLTHSPLGEPGGVFHILFNMFVLWSFGREVEWRLGRYEFLRFYAAALIVSGLGWALFQMATGQVGYAVGASGGVSAVLFLFIVSWPQRTIALFGVFEMPAWKMGVGIVVIGALLLLTSADEHVAHEAHLVGAAFGAAYGRFGWSFSRLSFGDWRRTFRRFKPQPKLKVHDPETYYHDLDSEADALLAKIHKHGEESLTNEERKKLEDYARRMRQKHR